MKIMGIYKITSPSGRVYIGQGIDIKKRWIDYRCYHCKNQTKLYNSFMKYGSKNHVYEVLEECLQSELNDRERYYQDLYNSSCPKIGLNCRLTQSSDKSGKLSEEHKRKISESEKGKTVSQDTREKISKALKGIKRSEEFKENLRKLNTGRKMSEESCKKLSESRRGKPWTEEARINYMNSDLIGKKVINIKTGEIFKSAREANDSLGWSTGKLAKYLRGDRINNTDFIYLENTI